MQKKNALFAQYPHMLHGGDYNPEQWKATPEIWDEDVRLAKLSGCNCFSVGIFSWWICAGLWQKNVCSGLT